MKTHLIFGTLLGAALALLGPMAAQCLGDFTLHGNEQFTVNESHNYGYLWDVSRASVVSGGSVNGKLYAHDSSTVDISAGSVSFLYAYNSSAVEMSGGSVPWNIAAYDSSKVHLSGGTVNYLWALDSAALDISGGSVGQHLEALNSSTVKISAGNVKTCWAEDSSSVQIIGGNVTTCLYAWDSSTVSISGGSIFPLYAQNSSSVHISGGSVGVHASDSSTVTFHGRNFVAGSGLTLDGNRVLGTGTLKGEWADGTPCTVSIGNNPLSATILAAEGPWAVAHAGGCEVGPSDTALLDGSVFYGSGIPVSWAWDLDADGEYDEAIGPKPSLTYDQLVGQLGMQLGQNVIWLQIHTSDGLVVTDAGSLILTPEPATLSLLALGGLLALRRRR
ncbi:MAG: PEP-CTERM sorting domain-containing protein [Planctomycetota bacterium]|nr:PEP-CTERM sorting domain-containing protein [Planctomycetota bacterium]